MSSLCAAHPDRGAVYECDGCKRLLCEECLEEGHRLLFCRHCGEMAIPLAGGAPATTTELARERKITATHGLGDALAYPLRGLGLYLFAGYVLLVVLLELANTAPELGCGLFFIQLLILLILPGFLFAIVRTSAEGETQPRLLQARRLRTPHPSPPDAGLRRCSAVAIALATVCAGLADRCLVVDALPPPSPPGAR